MDVDARTVADAARKQHCDLVIHGHTHQAGTYVVAEDLNRIVLPDWKFEAANRFCGGYLSFRPDQLILQKFH